MCNEHKFLLFLCLNKAVERVDHSNRCRISIIRKTNRFKRWIQRLTGSTIKKYGISSKYELKHLNLRGNKITLHFYISFQRKIPFHRHGNDVCVGWWRIIYHNMYNLWQFHLWSILVVLHRAKISHYVINYVYTKRSRKRHYIILESYQEIDWLWWRILIWYRSAGELLG